MSLTKQLKSNRGLVMLIALAVGFIFMTGLTSVSADRYVGSATVNTNKETITVNDNVLKYDLSDDQIAQGMNPPYLHTLAIYTNDHNVVTKVEPILDWYTIFMLSVVLVGGILFIILIWTRPHF